MSKEVSMQEKPPATPQLAYSPKQVAQMIGRSRSFVMELLWTGEIKGLKRGTVWFISKEAVETWLAGGASHDQ